jgi:hypothetical protein
MNVEIITILRPYCSDNGENARGATTYPIKYIDVGSTSCAWLVTPNCSAVCDDAPVAIEDPIVLFRTNTMPVIVT